MPHVNPVFAFAPYIRTSLAVSLLVGVVFIGLLLVFGKVPLSYNVRNLMIRWKTTIMTALAFTLVVALMTVMMAFVNGMLSLTESSGQPGNVVILSKGATDEGFSNLALGDMANVERVEGIITGEDGKRLASKEVVVVGNQQIPVQPGELPRRRFVQIRGVEDPVITGAVHGLKLKPGGRWFSEAGVEEAPATGGEAQGQVLLQAVMGHGLAAEIGADRPDHKPLEAGDTFSMADRTWRITGILDSKGSTYDSEIWAKRQLAGENFGKATSYSSFVVRAAGPKDAEALAERLSNLTEVSLSAITETKYFSNLAENSRTFAIAIGIVAIVMGVGGFFGVMNTMFAAISQRTKDIGVLRILGFKSGQILVSFLLESLVIALIGGILGCALGLVADGWTARSIVQGQGGPGKFVVLQLVVSGDILALGLLLSLGMGAFGGFIPAVSAMRLRALESLR